MVMTRQSSITLIVPSAPWFQSAVDYNWKKYTGDDTQAGIDETTHALAFASGYKLYTAVRYLSIVSVRSSFKLGYSKYS